MQWTRYIDAYCERTDPGYWAEPLNAVTNLAVLLAAAMMWRRSRGLPLARLLCLILGIIGIGSYLFHTHATAWASSADTTPIALFILTYIYSSNRHYLELPVWLAASGAAAFIPWTMLLTPVFRALPYFDISAVYWPVPVLISGYALLLRWRARRTAWRLLGGAGLLTLSLVFRSLDTPLCEAIPVGTHFLWHLLNAAMLAWMIETYRRHMLEAGLAGR